MCVNCLRLEVDISEGIPKQLIISWCKGCGRYLEPPSKWITCTLESKELLMFCLRRVKGLSKVKLIEANFVWTEPHSKRLKVKLTCQKEVYNSTILQQTFIIEYIISNQFCVDCHQHEAGGDENTWVSVAQVRQKVTHKRTFYWLEQVILRHNAQTNATSIKQSPDGLDFYFSNLSHCKQFVDFLQSVVPIKFQQAKKLIGHDTKSNVHSYKFTYSVEMIPLCKDDLVCLPSKLSHQLGGISPIVIVYKVSNQLHLIDPWTLQSIELANNNFWNNPFRSICTKAYLTEFVVLDIHSPISEHGKFSLCEITVARSSDLGFNDIQFDVRCHFGKFINPGDTLAGYDLTTVNFVDSDMTDLGVKSLPQIVLIKKVYTNRRLKPRQRHWKLKQLAKEEELQRRNNELAKEQKDYEEFLQELEEDTELRSQVNLYKTNVSLQNQSMQVEGDEDEPDFPDIKIEELLVDVSEMTIDPEI